MITDLEEFLRGRQGRTSAVGFFDGFFILPRDMCGKENVRVVLKVDFWADVEGPLDF